MASFDACITYTKYYKTTLQTSNNSKPSHACYLVGWCSVCSHTFPRATCE